MTSRPSYGQVRHPAPPPGRPRVPPRPGSRHDPVRHRRRRPDRPSRKRTPPDRPGRRRRGQPTNLITAKPKAMGRGIYQRCPDSSHGGAGAPNPRPSRSGSQGSAAGSTSGLAWTRLEKWPLVWTDACDPGAVQHESTRISRVCWAKLGVFGDPSCWACAERTNPRLRLDRASVTARLRWQMLAEVAAGRPTRSARRSVSCSSMSSSKSSWSSDSAPASRLRPCRPRR